MFNLTPSRIYYFLFFNCAYAFLSFWIGITYFLDVRLFFWAGVGFYIFTFLFHKGFMVIVARNEGKYVPDLRIDFFYAGLILICILYLLGTYFMQQFLIRGSFVPSGVFEKVHWSLTLFSLIASWLLSFAQKK